MIEINKYDRSVAIKGYGCWVNVLQFANNNKPNLSFFLSAHVTVCYTHNT